MKSIAELALNAVSQGVIITGVDGLILSANAAFLAITGYSEAEVLGHNCRFIQGPDTAPDTVEAIRTSIQQHTEFAGEILNYRKDGSPFWNELTIAPVRNLGGVLTHFIGVTRDITERKSAQLLLAKSHQALEQSTELLERTGALAEIGGWQVDLATMKLTWTLQTFRIADREPPIEPPLDEGINLFAPEARPTIAAAVQAAMDSGTPYDLELPIITPTGRHKWVQTQGFAEMRDGKTVRLYGTFQDITQRKKAEQALAKTHTELERSNADLEQFAYAASHDLQEPLRSVTSAVQLLKLRYAGKLDERADEFIAHAVSGTLRMRQLIEDLLRYSRVNASELTKQPVALDAVLSLALSNLAQATKEADARITHDALPVLPAHKELMVTLLQNLVGNALKFRGDKPAVVHVGARQTADEWVLSVTDQGIGIAPAYFERIFRLFQRLHTRSEYAGTGIGLALCERIVHRHGGRIWVESEPGKGATFYFTLPLQD